MSGTPHEMRIFPHEFEPTTGGRKVRPLNNLHRRLRSGRQKCHFGFSVLGLRLRRRRRRDRFERIEGERGKCYQGFANYSTSDFLSVQKVKKL